jgi:hypothetical protein
VKQNVFTVARESPQVQAWLSLKVSLIVTGISITVAAKDGIDMKIILWDHRTPMPKHGVPAVDIEIGTIMVNIITEKDGTVVTQIYENPYSGNDPIATAYGTQPYKVSRRK